MSRRPVRGSLDGAPWIALSVICIGSVAFAKDTFTTCQDICDTLTSAACTVTTTHEVVAGSNVDCTTARSITINGGQLQVHDGTFVLRGKNLTLTNGGKIVADCPQDLIPVGFHLRDVGCGDPGCDALGCACRDVHPALW